MSNIRRRQPTEAEKARIQTAISEESTPQVIAENEAKIRRLRASKRSGGTVAQHVIGLLRKRKAEEDLSLSELQARTGIDSGNLSRLLNADEPNLTLETVERLATAMHCTIQVTLQPVE